MEEESILEDKKLVIKRSILLGRKQKEDSGIEVMDW